MKIQFFPVRVQTAISIEDGAALAELRERWQCSMSDAARRAIHEGISVLKKGGNGGEKVQDGEATP